MLALDLLIGQVRFPEMPYSEGFCNFIHLKYPEVNHFDGCDLDITSTTTPGTPTKIITANDIPQTTQITQELIPTKIITEKPSTTPTPMNSNLLASSPTPSFRLPSILY